MKGKVIKSLKELDKVLTSKKLLDEVGGMGEFAIVLNGGLFSRKYIQKLENGKYHIIHCIDDTTQTLTGKSLLSKTNIGEAMEKGAFTQVLDY